MLKFFKKNISNQFIRLCRIQYSSKLRNQNKYTEHHYKIKFNFGGIYDPINSTNINERVADLFISSNGMFLFTNDSSIYTKITSDIDNSYIDIAYSMLGLYSTNIKIEVETEELGSVQFYCDEATQNEYTRQNFWGTNENVMLHKGNTSIYVAPNNSANISTSKNFTRITDIRANNVGYVMPDGTIKSGDNSSFTLSVTSSNTFGRIINITAKTNNDLLVENL